jgi:hypothetical protein
MWKHLLISLFNNLIFKPRETVTFIGSQLMRFEFQEVILSVNLCQDFVIRSVSPLPYNLDL